MSTTYKNLLLSTTLVLTYLFVEWIYNQHLLVLLSYDSINPDNFEVTERFGKSIASFGLTLIFYHIYKKGILFFIICVSLFYGFLTLAFDYAVNAFPDDFRYSTYYSMLYRKDVINRNDKNEILKFTEDKTWYEKSLVISQFIYVLKDEQWKEFEKKVKQPISEKISKLNKNRIQYYKNYQKFDSYYQPIMNKWGTYSSAESTYTSYKGFFKGNAKKEFIKKVGLPPGLSFDEFTKKIAPEYYKSSYIKLFEGSSESKLQPIYIKDLPKGMNEIAFNEYIDNQLKKISTELAPEVNNIRSNKKSFNSLAVLVIPPISICLSLFSIFINILFLLVEWFYLIFKIKKFNSIIHSFIYVFVLFIIILLWTNSKTTATEQDPYWNSLKETNYAEKPMLFYIFTLGLKLEPTLCFTNEEPEMIKKFTHLIYDK